MQAFFVPHMMIGGTNVVMGRYDALETIRTIERERITTLFAVPTQIVELIEHPAFAEHDTSSLKMITTGGAAIAEATMRRALDELCPRIYNGYGMTEASLTLLLHPEDAITRLGSCGRPTLISRCRVIRHDPARPARDVAPSEMTAPDEIGQLIVHGPQVMKGYWNNPFETQKKLKAGWVYTGDLFSRDARGLLPLPRTRGRHDRLGRREHPPARGRGGAAPLSPAFARRPSSGFPTSAGGSSSSRSSWTGSTEGSGDARGPVPDAAALDAFCRTGDELAPYKRPKRYLFVDALPTNPSGKVVKRALLERATAAG